MPEGILSVAKNKLSIRKDLKHGLKAYVAETLLKLYFYVNYCDIGERRYVLKLM